MNKIIGCITVLLLSLTVKAQVKIGVKGGWNYSTAKAFYNGAKQPTTFVNGLGVGAMLNVPFDGVLHFSPSVMLNYRGFIVKPISGPNKKEQYSIPYLDLIPALSVDFENGENAFSISTGPVLGFTNFGKLKITDSSNKSNTQKLKFGFAEYGWIDLGLSSSISYRIKKLLLEAVFYTGLTNINNKEEADQRNIRYRMFSLNIGYYFKQTAH